MKQLIPRFVSVFLCSCMFPILAGKVWAQGVWEPDKFNMNLGVILSMPVGSTGDLANKYVGMTIGAGYNFNPHHSFIAEFMWNGLDTSSQALIPVRAALQDNSLNGHSNLYAITGNYRFQREGKVLGVYAIGGAGWYYRTAGFSKAVTSGGNISCAPAWLWWGFSCVAGMVTPNQTVRGFNSSVFGGNGGVGFTVKVADPSYRMYIEPRYHYAPTKNISTQVLDITVGIRY